MPREEFPISTGVDGLVKLIREKGKVGLAEAAVELGIPQSVIEEWATVLEKEGVIKIDYLFTKVYLSWSEKGKKEVERKIEEVGQEQMILGREAESQLKRIEKLGSKLDEFKKEFVKVSDVYDSKISGIRHRIEELVNLERQFEEISFRGREVAEKFNNELAKITTQIDGDEKKIQEIRKMKDELEKSLKEIKQRVEKPKAEKGAGK